MMCDNRTTELKTLSKLKMAGKLRLWRGTIEMTEDELHAICDEIQAEHEQAIAMTLGIGTLTAEQVSKATYAHSIHADCADADWQAIADELNAALGGGECEPNWVLQGKTQTQEFWRCDCGNCGECFGVESRESFPFKVTIDKVNVPNYCPNCGIRINKGEI